MVADESFDGSARVGLIASEPRPADGFAAPQSTERRCNSSGTGAPLSCWFNDFAACRQRMSHFLHREDINDALEISSERPRSPADRSVGRARHRHRSGRGGSLHDRTSKAATDEFLRRAEPIRALVIGASVSRAKGDEEIQMWGGQSESVPTDDFTQSWWARRTSAFAHPASSVNAGLPR